MKDTSQVGALGAKMLEQGITTTKDLERQQTEKAAAAQQQAKANEPPPPPARTSVLERMSTELVPLDELIAAQKQIALELRREDREAQEERREGHELFKELKGLREHFDQLLRNSRGHGSAETRQALLFQYDERRRLAAAKLGEDDLEHLENAEKIMTLADAGEHFGNLRHALNVALSRGFLVPISDKRAIEEQEADRGRYVFNHPCEDADGNKFKHCFPRNIARKLDRLVLRSLFGLRARATRLADLERLTQLSILDAGTLPEPQVLRDALDSRQPLPASVRFGCMLLQLAVKDQSTKALYGYNGAADIVIETDEAGQRCMTVARMSGAIEQVLQAGVRVVITRERSSEVPVWASALFNHLADIAQQVLLTDEEVARRNEKYRAKKMRSRLIPETQAQREYRFAELRGDFWRKRNERWIKRQRSAGESDEATDASREMLGLLKEQRRPDADVLLIGLHTRYQVPEAIECALYVRDFATQERVADEDVGSVRREPRLSSGVVHLRVEPTEEAEKRLTLVRAVGPIAAVMPEAGTSWTFGNLKAASGPVSPQRLKRNLAEVQMPSALLGHLHVQGFTDEACGVAALHHAVPALQAEGDKRRERKRTRKAPVVEVKAGANGAAPAEQPTTGVQ